ncbi:oxygen-dependent protoporphyrinogen oxidase [Paenibacillus phyllosphaerae]|uniref:Coproporphyrinogen III oxidase n=1 Tax=Paenibacillus phyllosphaerae TaxID=274593 RepID=A0A7W5FNG5_9BACL|nr:oxygen-dependent protoporphyrinogen oxidase [Paenibacillus phyllosphaerae]
MDETKRSIVIIGGGITGLCAAYELIKSSPPNSKLDITLLESSSQLGGAIQTLRRDGFVIEKGPDSFLFRKPAVVQLCKELGLEKDLVAMSPDSTKSFIYMNKQLHPMPEGLSLGIPTRIGPFIKTDLLTLKGKVRAAMDFIIPRRTATDDESLGSLIKRRLGTEVADHLVSPVLAGIYAGDLNKLSTAATFPQMAYMEQKHRSLILGMLANRRTVQDANSSEKHRLPEHLKKSMFLSLREGLMMLVERLNDVLRSSGVQIITKCEVRRVVGVTEGYQISTTGKSYTADRIIFAVPAEQTREILGERLPGPLVEALTSVPGVSVVNLAMAFNESDIPVLFKGAGFVIPRDQGMRITACTLTSQKWPHTTSPGKVLLRAYIGHSDDQKHVDEDDATLIDVAYRELSSILSIQRKPLFCEISRHYGSMPQYLPGHLDRITKLEEQVGTMYPGIIMAGKSFRGVGIPDCIRQGRDAAKKLIGAAG